MIEGSRMVILVDGQVPEKEAATKKMPWWIVLLLLLLLLMMAQEVEGKQ